MNDIKSDAKTAFFPKDKKSLPSIAKNTIPSTNKPQETLRKKSTQLNNGETDAKVDIPKKIRDFSKIKKAVDMAPEINNAKKIALLKRKIESGEYKVDYDKVADKVLNEEMELRSS